MDFDGIFEAVCNVIIKTVLKFSLKSIGLTTFGENFVVLDENYYMNTVNQDYWDIVIVKEKLRKLYI